MELREQSVNVYVDSRGHCPFERWLSALRDKVAKQKVLVRLARVRLGNIGDAKSVGDGVRELRIDWGPGYRVYFGEHGKELTLLLCGGDKSTQARDIRKAKEFWNDYQANRTSKGF